MGPGCRHPAGAACGAEAASDPRHHAGWADPRRCADALTGPKARVWRLDGDLIPIASTQIASRPPSRLMFWNAARRTRRRRIQIRPAYRFGSDRHGSHGDIGVTQRGVFLSELRDVTSALIVDEEPAPMDTGEVGERKHAHVQIAYVGGLTCFDCETCGYPCRGRIEVAARIILHDPPGDDVVAGRQVYGEEVRADIEEIGVSFTDGVTSRGDLESGALLVFRIDGVDEIGDVSRIDAVIGGYAQRAHHHSMPPCACLLQRILAIEVRSRTSDKRKCDG